MFKKVDFGDIDGEKLNHLRFAGDIVIIANRVDEAREMLRRLNEVLNSVELKINGSKTQFMSNLIVIEDINLNGSNLELVNSYKYLEIIKISKI